MEAEEVAAEEEEVAVEKLAYDQATIFLETTAATPDYPNADPSVHLVDIL